MQIQENISLRQFHTFHIEVLAEKFAVFESVAALQALITASRGVQRIILGGGSNMLFTKNVAGWILKNELKGVEIVEEDDEYIYVRAGAGENWHGFVQHALQQNWAGLENLALIPGNVGAAPMQNIGAYGVELEEIFHELEAFHLEECTVHRFKRSDCAFGYRESIFKNRYKNQFVILNVVFRLRKQPVFNIGYGAIQQELAHMEVKDLTIQAVAQAVINIRSSKLPDPAVTGNAGSFFKNPSVAAIHYAALQKEFPGIVGYANSDGSIKLAAGWLIENSGPTEGSSWKGFREGDCGVHPKQALVLVNYANASGKQVFDLSETISQSVWQKFQVRLEREVNIY